MKSSSKRRFLPINSGWKRDCQSDRPFTPFPCGAAHNAGEGGLMSISRSRDCIHSSCSGHSSSSSRNRADCSFRWGSEGVGRVVDRWIACIFTANHTKRRLVPRRLREIRHLKTGATILNPSPHGAGLSANAEKTAHSVGLKDP